MPPLDALTLVAEVAVGLAGFAGDAVMLGITPGPGGEHRPLRGAAGSGP